MGGSFKIFRVPPRPHDHSIIGCLFIQDIYCCLSVWFSLLLVFREKKYCGNIGTNFANISGQISFLEIFVISIFIPSDLVHVQSWWVKLIENICFFYGLLILVNFWMTVIVMEIQLKFRITIKITGKTIFQEENCVKDKVSEVSIYLWLID